MAPLPDSGTMIDIDFGDRETEAVAAVTIPNGTPEAVATRRFEGTYVSPSPGVKSTTDSESKSQNRMPNKASDQLRDLWNKFIWHGGSITDAWLTSSCGQAGQVLLTLPTSYAQMGFGFGIAFQFLYTSIGCWTSYLLNTMYKEYRHRREGEGADFTNHVIQYHEVMRYLAGQWAGYFSLIFNILSIGAVSLMQLTSSASTIHLLNQTLNKRQWTYIMGAGMMLTFLVPTIHNYRLMSFVALATATYTSWYMVVAALAHGQIRDVCHTGAADLGFFTGTANVLFAFSAHTVSIETMHAMWHPTKYTQVVMNTSAYVLTITMPHSLALYWAFGDNLLKHNNALAVLPHSKFRSVAIVCMLIHQAIVFGLFSLPLNVMWEKTVGVHQSKHYLVRVCSRIPVGLLIWFLAIAFPFLGPTNSLVGSLIISFSAIIIPCAVHMYTFRTAAARQNAARKPTKWLPGWDGMVGLNMITIVVIAVLGVGLGGWASVTTFTREVNRVGVFNKCYQCK